MWPIRSKDLTQELKEPPSLVEIRIEPEVSTTFWDLGRKERQLFRTKNLTYACPELSPNISLPVSPGEMDPGKCEP